MSEFNHGTAEQAEYFTKADCSCLIPWNTAVTHNLSEFDGTLCPCTDATRSMLKLTAPGSWAKYIVPDGINGIFDIYLRMCRPEMFWGNTPFSVSVNGQACQVQPVDMWATLDAAGEDGLTPGTFLVARKVLLSPNDSISVEVYGTMKGLVIPYIGDMLLFPEDSPVPVGFGDGILPQKIIPDPDDPLCGKTILWLGSSVTFGMAADGYSMVNYISEKHPSCTSIKYTISGTTLVNDVNDGTSYVERLKNDVWPGYDSQIDLVIVQLSTNDASQGKPLGELLPDHVKTPEAFDVSTVTGAEEWIVAYVRKRFSCNTVFYTGPYYESDAYADMVKAIGLVCRKWNIGLFDLWNLPEMRALYGTDQYRSYMPFDGIHPNYAGYHDWIGPQIDHQLTTYFTASETID